MVGGSWDALWKVLIGVHLRRERIVDFGSCASEEGASLHGERDALSESLFWTIQGVRFDSSVVQVLWVSRLVALGGMEDCRVVEQASRDFLARWALHTRRRVDRDA